MEKKWYEVSVKYNKNVDTDITKKVSEKYLVHASTPAEAEAKEYRFSAVHLTKDEQFYAAQLTLR